MRILMYLLSIIVLCGVFELGSIAIQQSQEWSLALTPQARRNETLRKSFFYSGKIMQTAALISGFLAMVALLALIADFAL